MSMRTEQKVSHYLNLFISVCLRIQSYWERNVKFDFLSLRLYDTDVDSFEFINESNHTISISCFGQQINTAPKEKRELINTDKKKFRHIDKNES